MRGTRTSSGMKEGSSERPTRGGRRGRIGRQMDGTGGCEWGVRGGGKVRRQGSLARREDLSYLS